MRKCPNSADHQKFVGTAHVTQEWVIDKDNNFDVCTSECLGVVHAPDKQDLITCKSCGAEAAWIEI